MSRTTADERVGTLVIGAGISGLTFAHALGPDADVVVLEAGTRVGGLLRTETVPEDPGARFEMGAEMLQLQPTLAAELSAAAGVPITSASKTAARRYLVTNGELAALPESPLKMFTSPLLSLSGKFRGSSERFRDPTLALDGSIADFARHRFGREILETFVDPFVSGVHAGDPEQLSVRAAFPMIVEMVERHGSVLRGLSEREGERMSLFKPGGGMQRLPEGLARSLGEKLRMNGAVRTIRRESGGFVASGDTGEFHTRRVVVATEGTQAAQLLRDVAPIASRELGAMQFESLVAVVHGWNRSAVEHPLDGFGFLAPSREKLLTLGTLFSSSIDPTCAPADRVVLRTLLGGARHPELVGWSDEQLLAKSLDENSGLLGLRGAPRWTRIVRYRSKIPRYDLDHPRRVTAIEADIAKTKGLLLLGNSLRALGVGPLILRARELAACG